MHASTVHDRNENNRVVSISMNRTNHWLFTFGWDCKGPDSKRTTKQVSDLYGAKVSEENQVCPSSTARREAPYWNITVASVLIGSYCTHWSGLVADQQTGSRLSILTSEQAVYFSLSHHSTVTGLNGFPFQLFYIGLSILSWRQSGVLFLSTTEMLWFWFSFQRTYLTIQRFNSVTELNSLCLCTILFVSTTVYIRTNEHPPLSFF